MAQRLDLLSPDSSLLSPDSRLHLSPAWQSEYILVPMEKIKIEHGCMGTLWLGAWLFTIGFLRLTFWKAVLAILLWPYFLGVKFGPLPH